MERCPKCGNKLSNIDVLCPRCGALVEVIQVRSSFIPPAGSSPSPQNNERPKLIVYNEDYPGEGPFTGVDDDEVPPLAPPVAEESSSVPALSSSEASEPVVSQPVFPNDATVQSPPEDDGTFPESRVARRARQRQYLELEEIDPSSVKPEDQILKEAEALTSGKPAAAHEAVSSRMQARRRAAQSSSASPSAAADMNAIDDIDANGPVETAPPVAVDSFPSDDISEVAEHRYRPRERRSSTTDKGASVSRLSPPAAILLWVMLAAAIFLGFFFFDRYVQTSFGGYEAFIHQITNGKIELSTDGAASDSVNVTSAVSKTSEGAPAHTFSISAPGATSVRILPTGDSFDMTDGQTTFTIADEAIARAKGVVTYDSTVQADGVNIDLTFGSSTRNYPIDTFDLFLLPSEYTREAPLQGQSSSSSDFVPLSIKVAPGSKVYLNNEDYSSKIDNNGLLSADLPLPASGDNIFAVDVIQPGRQAVKDSFTVTRQIVSTILNPEVKYLRSFNESFECRGTTEAGATLRAELNGQTFAGLVSETGAYSAACKATGYGLFTVKLTAASADKADNVAEVLVECLPDASGYKSQAVKKTVADVIKNATKLIDSKIRLTGKLEGLTTDGSTQKFTLSSGTDKLSCYYYDQTSSLSADTEYTMYGTMDETGSFYVMFID